MRTFSHKLQSYYSINRCHYCCGNLKLSILPLGRDSHTQSEKFSSRLLISFCVVVYSFFCVFFFFRIVIPRHANKCFLNPSMAEIVGSVVKIIKKTLFIHLSSHPFIYFYIDIPGAYDILIILLIFKRRIYYGIWNFSHLI